MTGDVVIVGASAGGLTVAEVLRRKGFDGRIRLVGAEVHPPYDRPPLSKEILTGAWGPERALLRDDERLDALGAEFILGRHARHLDLTERTVKLDDGRTLGFGSLVIATGVTPRRLGCQRELAGVSTFRTLDDAMALRRELAGPEPGASPATAQTVAGGGGPASTGAGGGNPDASPATAQTDAGGSDPHAAAAGSGNPDAAGAGDGVSAPVEAWPSAHSGFGSAVARPTATATPAAQRAATGTTAARQAATGPPAARRVVIVGAGVLGCEIAAAARELGHEVTLVEPGPVPMERQLGLRVGGHVAAMHRDRGVKLRTGVNVTAFLGTERLSGVELSDGSVLAAELAVVTAGSVPATGWLANSGLGLVDGVECDEYGRAAPGVYAVGDVARWRHPVTGVSSRIETRTNASEQAMTVATNILGGNRCPTPVPYFWSDQYDTRIQLYGTVTPHSHIRVIDGAVDDGRFVALAETGDTVTAAIGWNNPRGTRTARARLTAVG
ncbi:NAD(P)/FAD-dependent oxidoreductase [Stackebrandtia nassauensis]|uniref:FAD-dependent pyridine nucleotide-disulfide oxidoreductase n=1 Tax=Stackebrandtia nassauensis (strain DSM 44728 / CIP 108903 / NRRL B-16338 / NBRC 102104 / LLR-40K-21) TaxID=446470 RepID=D3PX75_STANL|nr:FAD-dependent oxidoreductase [Stackebrandtia nassauensis]ADD41338.1 FAD-dependent pyridine nucleotide-disulfide oxidoreductase [Stackebrandtia nassauensis DSM 44728]